MALRIGRLRIEVYQNALYLQREPKPNCKDCNGVGRTDPESQGIETDPATGIELCDCWNPWGGIRIPLIRRAPITERYPF